MQSTISPAPSTAWKAAILAIVVVMAAGCSLTPGYERPAQSLPMLSGSMSPAPTDQDMHTLLSPEELKFLDGLDGSGQLKVLAVRGLQHNRDYAVAVLRVDQARAEYGLADADSLPTLRAGGQVERQHFNNKTLNETYGQRFSAATVGISDFELDFFGRVKALSESARHEYLATEFGQQAARKALIAEVAHRYLFMRAAASRQQGADALLVHRKTQLRLAQKQESAGDISREELQAVHALQAQAEQQAEEASLQLDKARNALEHEIGYELAIDTDRQQGPSEAEKPAPIWLANLTSEHLLQRFDVQAAEERLKAANASIGAARAAFFPSITLSTSSGIASEHLHDLFSSGTGTWLFAPQINIPLFDGGRNQANLDLAKVRKEVGIANYEKAIQSAFRDMADGLHEREALLQRARSQSALNDIAQEQLVSRQAQARRGDVSRLDELAAHIQAVQTEQALLETRLAIQLNLLSLYRVLYGADASAISS
ncbi:TPA: efflux transporter outer membrane subunit [Pseudomonas aeruginosa]|jgi:multidrug efflux system outer membrane protein|uniref:efflux transporter outer membrane subunit n=2 Tax=Pseudomonas aeruginosa TaxID=287 RepID=UPI0037CA6A76|nr:efflux transporter outer membrane subunit [Pseudomonas aeruginosa]